MWQCSDLRQAKAESFMLSACENRVRNLEHLDAQNHSFGSLHLICLGCQPKR